MAALTQFNQYGTFGGNQSPTPQGNSQGMYGGFSPSPTMPNQSPTSQPTQNVGGGSPGAYDQSVASRGYNPTQYATDETTQRLANMFGGQTMQTQGAGPNAPPPQNYIDFGGGYIGNAGLSQSFIDSYGLDRAKQMFADQARIAQGGTDSEYTNPSFNTYNPSAPVMPSSFNTPNPSFGAPTPMKTPPQALGAQQSQQPQQPMSQANFGFQPQGQFQGQGQGSGIEQLLPLLLMSQLFGGGGQQQQNPFGQQNSGLGGFGGVAQLLQLIGGLQGGQQVQPAATPNTNLYFPLFG